MTPEQITMKATAIAVEISKCKSLEELAELRVVLRQVLATLDTIAITRGLKKFEELEKERGR